AALRAAREKLSALARNVQQYEVSDDLDPLCVTRVQMPRVSIVIAAFDRHAFTRACIRSIVRHTEPGQYEIIVVDDASDERVSSALGHVSGLGIVRNESNLGFIGSCNRGATLARGEVVVFLSHDTLVSDGWLTALLSALGQP